MSLENIRLREGSQIPKDTECVGPFMGSVQNRQIHRDRAWIHSCLGLGEVGGEWLLNESLVSFWSVENILELDSGGVCASLWMY